MTNGEPYRADVCLNDGGLVCRIAWSPTTGKRFRPGLLLRLAERFESDRAPDPESAAGGRPWMVTELWDYGRQVEINPPSDLIDRSRTSMRTIVMDLWRRKRDYERTRRRR
ncbi:MAG: hypothetical protein JO027_03640 [Solirubrobacterales bacterium]|nr:hypothetical protein [Solirubrobacterales bacterium]